MPLKLNASFCKKVPAEVEYSSKSYLASLELELPTNLSSDELNAEIHKTYAQLERAVEEQIKGQTTNHQSAPAEGKASNRQVGYLLDLAKARNVTLMQINVDIQKRYGVHTVYDLSRRDCSRLIDEYQQAA